MNGGTLLGSIGKLLYWVDTLPWSVAVWSNNLPQLARGLAGVGTGDIHAVEYFQLQLEKRFLQINSS